MDALIVRRISQLKNARLGKLLVSCVKELHTTWSVSHLPQGTRNYQAAERSQKKLRENSEESAMKEVIEDPDGEGLNRFFTQACYSCG